MGLPIIQINCDKCGYEENAPYFGAAKYCLNDGKEIPIENRICWCNHCRSVQFVEDLALQTRLDKLSKLREQIASLRFEPRLFQKRWTYVSEKFSSRSDIRWTLSQDTPSRWAEALSDAIAGIAFIEKIARKEKCLNCAGTDYVSASCEREVENKLPLHPSCGGRLQFKNVGSINVGSNGPRRHKLYSTDAEFLGWSKD